MEEGEHVEALAGGGQEVVAEHGDVHRRGDGVVIGLRRRVDGGALRALRTRLRGVEYCGHIGGESFE